MAVATFSYNGENYTVDNATNPPTLTRMSPSGPVQMSSTSPGWNDVKLRAAMNQAIADSPKTTAGPPAAGATTATTAGTDYTAREVQPDGRVITTAADGRRTMQDAQGNELLVQLSPAPGSPAALNPAKPEPIPNATSSDVVVKVPMTQGSDSLTDPLGTGNNAGANTATTAAPAADAKPAPAATGAAARNAAAIASLNTAKAATQKQLDDLRAKAADPDSGLDPTTLSSQINNLTDQIAKYDVEIANNLKEPAPAQQATSVVSGEKPSDKWRVTIKDGVVVTEQNPIWNGVEPTDTTYTHGQIGNNVYTLNPKTGDVTVAFTDNDAKQLAILQGNVAQKNADTARLQQVANENQQKFDQELARRVSNGEDAASVRAEQQLQINRDYTQWQQSNGDAKTAQDALNAYETVRHQKAIDDLGVNNYNETVRAAKATEAYNAAKLANDEKTANLTAATGMRNTDVAAQGTKYAADQTAVTARMNAANSLLQSGMTMLADVNKYLPPGSDLAGKALEGLMAYGQKFLTGMAGPAPTMPTAPALSSYGLPGVGGAGTPGAPAPGSGSANLAKTQADLAGGGALKPVVNATDNAQQQVLANNAPVYGQAPTGTGLGASAGRAVQGAASPNPTGVQIADTGTPTFAQNPQIEVPTPQGSIGLGRSAANVMQGFDSSNMANLFSNANPAQALFEQNAAAHQQNMQPAGVPPPPNIAADGTPYATASDVARVWGRS